MTHSSKKSVFNFISHFFHEKKIIADQLFNDGLSRNFQFRAILFAPSYDFD